MAGESPDRSKQRESSAEPTSGNTGPVPESAPQDRPARDPRLSVARETGSPSASSDTSEARGGVDTATRVFSIRDLKTEAEAAAGPAAGETSAGGPGAGETEAEQFGGEGTAADKPGTAEAETGKASAEKSAVTRPRAEGTAAGEPGTAKAEVGKAVAERAEAGKASAEEPGTAEAEAGEAVVEKPGAVAGGPEGEEPVVEGAAVEESAVESGTAEAEESAVEDSGAGRADAASESADSADAAAATKGDETGDARLRAAVAAWVRSGDSKDSEEPADAETAAEADQDGASEAEAGPDGDSDVEDGAVADSDETEPEEDGPEDAAPEADADSDSVAETGSETGAGSETDADSEAGVGSETAVGSETGADPETDVDAQTDTHAETGDQPETRDEDGTGDSSETGREPEADADAETGGEPGAESGPAVADGEEAPKGPPAAGSGTGGAGGSVKAEGKAEVEDRPVDQPTAIFKRPTKLQLDQPTTMLKLGGALKDAKTSEPSEAERTSKFVALKPLDEPRTPRKPADATAPVPQVGPERTAQQPLPPKPPLDLLAELTNTPPPPQTPVRTIIRRVKIWTPLVLLLAIIFAIVQSVRPLPTPSLALTAKDSYTFDGGQVNLPWPSKGQGWMDGDGIGTMGSFGKQTPVAIGSVAKTMTSYIILRDHPLKPGQEGPKIKVDSTAEKEGGYDKSGGESTLNTVKAGDYLTEKQALSAVMIPSANNIARLLARWDAGSEAAFVKKMNAAAKGLGMTNTTYTDPSGLTPSTVSTAQDQVKLGRAFVKVPALVAITSAASWTDPSGTNWPNWNALPFKIGAIGIKTGSTTTAGGNLLFAARKTVGGQTVTIVGAILGQHKPPIIETANAVSKTALLAAQDALASAKILKKGDVVGYVDDQLGGRTPVVLTQDVTAVGWSGLKVKLSFDADDVPHIAKAGTKVGTLTVGDGTSGAVKVPVALQKDLAEPGFTAKLKRLG